MNNIKFHYKIYILSFFLVTFFVISAIIHQSNIKNISNNIKKLNQKNDSLQNLLILVSQTEKLHKNVYEFIRFGDDELLIYINQTLDNFKNIDKSINFIDDKNLYYSFRKIIQNIDRFREDFKIAEEQIPLNFDFRKNVREKAQNLENIADSLRIDNSSKKSLFDLILFKKSILEIEKAVFRYFETDDGSFIVKLKKEQLNLKYLLKELFKSNQELDSKMKKFIEKKVLELIGLSNKTISHYRTYSMITKVVMPGNIYEIDYYAQSIKQISFKEIGEIKNEIDHLLSINKNSNLIMSIIYTILVFISFFLLIRVLLRPIENLTLMFEDILQGKKEVQIPEYKQDDIIGKLIKAALEFKLLNNKTNELLLQTEDYKKNLEKKVKSEVTLRREKEKALIQQSKLASMGEMIGAIAHQWRQPLNELSIRIQKLKYNYAKEQIDEAFIKEFINKNKNTIDFMSKTIDDFRNFFRIDKQKKEFHVKDAIKEVLNIQNAQLKNHHIDLELNGDDFLYEGFKTEFQQVIINLLSNSKDALVQNNIQKPNIQIDIKEDIIQIRDNGGGIPQNVIDRVFEPYFTTKQQGEGTGMGLYMSKMIIEDNMSGKLKIENENDGVLITIDLRVKEV